MNIVQTLRLNSKLTQQAFAGAVGTSQPTIAAYESGSKSPTFRTVERMAGQVKLAMCCSVYPEMTREDRRSLAYHRAVVRLLEANPQPVLDKARSNLVSWTRDRSDARALFDRWALWLDLPLPDLLQLMMGLNFDGRDMRQVSPFAGVLSAEQRTAILQLFKKDEAA